MRKVILTVFASSFICATAFAQQSVNATSDRPDGQQVKSPAEWTDHELNSRIDQLQKQMQLQKEAEGSAFDPVPYERRINTLKAMRKGDE